MNATTTTPPAPLTDRSGLVRALLEQAVADSRARLGTAAAIPPPPVTPGRRARWTPQIVAGVSHARRAVHQFDDLGYTADALLTVAGEARHADAELWAGEVGAGRAVELVALAWRVDGLTPGAYRVTSGLDLEPVVSDRLPTPREFVIQHEFAAAPLMLLAGGDLAAALAAHGVHGHRLLAARAAAALHTAWLSTVALGGYGCLFGGVVDAAVRAGAGADGHRRSLVLGACLGLPGVG